MKVHRKLVILVICIVVILSLCSTGMCDTTLERARRNFMSNLHPTEEDLISFANAAFGNGRTYTANSLVPGGDTWIVLTYAHPRGSMLLISSRRYGNLYWEFGNDRQSVEDVCVAFAYSANLYDKARFWNYATGSDMVGSGSEVYSFYWPMFVNEIFPAW